MSMRKKVTSFDVARRAGVSRATVSYVLNNRESESISEGTRLRVNEAARELGYVPHSIGRALSSKKSGNIALLSRKDQLIHPFLQRVGAGLLESVQKQGLRLILDTLPREQSGPEVLRICRSRGIDGVILFNTLDRDPSLRELEKEDFPAVLIGEAPDLKLSTVDNDNIRDSKRAVNHLCGLGRKRIAMISNAPAAYSSSTGKLKGYKQALESRGIPFDEALVRWGDFSQESGYRCMKILLEERPDSCFAGNDIIALGAMRAIREAGLRVPEDIALIGFDDEPFASGLFPSLSTIHVDAHGMGLQAGDLLGALIRGETEPGERRILDSQLVIRESSGAG
jgi:LacI family transcriptional regulator